MFFTGWKFYLYLGIGIVLLGIAWKINHAFIEASKVPSLESTISALNNQIIEERERVKKNQQLTETISQTYETNLSKLDSDIKRLRSRAAQCYALSSAAETNRNNAASLTGIPPSANGISSDWLIDFAADSEKDRLKVLGLQSFINKIYQLNEE